MKDLGAPIRWEIAETDCGFRDSRITTAEGRGFSSGTSAGGARLRVILFCLPGIHVD